MKTLKIKIKTFEIYADEEDRESVVNSIMEHLEEVSDEAFYTSTVVEDEDSEDYEEEELV